MRAGRAAAWALAWLVVAVVAPPSAGAQQPTPTPSPTATPAATPPPAQFSGSVTVEAPPVVETARLDLLGSVVSSVSALQIEDLNAQDAAGALRRVPGVTVARYNPVGAYGGADGGAIYLRGQGSGRPGAEIATLVDGIPRFVGVWTHPLLDTLSLDPVDRIDVYRSPQPVLLGTMAFGAVDLVPKTRTGSGFAGRVAGSFGSFATVIGRAEAGWSGARGEAWVSASHRASDGHRDNADGRVNAAAGHGGWALDDHWAASLDVQHTDAWADDPGMVGTAKTPIVPHLADAATFVLASVSHEHRWGEGSIKLYSDDGSIDWLQWSPSPAEAFTTFTDWRNEGVRFRERVSPWQGGQIIAGLDLDRYGGSTFERHPSGDRPTSDVDFRTTAPYVILAHTFGRAVKVRPSLGARLISSREFGDHWVGQAGLAVDEGPRRWYVNAAHGVNLPGVWAAVMYGGFGRGDEWRDLEPEQIDHLEVGALSDLGRGWRVDVSLFHDRVTDALRFVPPPPPPPAFANLGDYTTRGVEASLHAPLGARGQLFAGATWTDTDPATVPNAPEVTVSAGLAWITPRKVRCNLDAEWVDSQVAVNPRFPAPATVVGAYALLNARVGVPLPEGLGVPGEVFLAGDNLLDEDYELRPGYPMPGRSWTLGLEARF